MYKFSIIYFMFHTRSRSLRGMTSQSPENSPIRSGNKMMTSQSSIVSSPIKTATSLSGNNEISNKFVFNLNVLIENIFIIQKKRL